MRYVSHLACSVCGTPYSGETAMNLCPNDGRPIQVVLDLDRLKADADATAGGTPPDATSGDSGACFPSISPTPPIPGRSSPWGEGCTPSPAYDHSLAERVGFHLQVKDEGRHDPGSEPIPRSRSRTEGWRGPSRWRGAGAESSGRSTQGIAGDALAEYAVAGDIEAAIVMSPDTDLPVLGKVPVYAQIYPRTSTSSCSPARSSTVGVGCASRTCPMVFFNVRHLPGARAGEPRARRRWAWKWPNRAVTGWRTAMAISGRHCLSHGRRHRSRRDGQGV